MTIALNYCALPGSNYFITLRCIVAAVVVALSPSASFAEQVQPTRSTELCWRSLTPDARPQGAIAESSLATRSNEVWISRRSFGPNLLKWSGGKWTLPPEPARTGVDQLWVEAIATSPSWPKFPDAAGRWVHPHPGLSG